MSSASIHVSQQYEIVFDGPKGESVVTVNYGVVEKFLMCALGDERVWGSFRNTTQLLAVITPFKTKGEDAAMRLTHYKDTATSIVTDIRNIKRLAGRVESRGEWGIVDRSNDLAHGTFVVDEQAEQGEYESASSTDT
jgi:hypothetical protein